MLSRQKNKYWGLLHMTPTAIFSLFREKFGTFFQPWTFLQFHKCPKPPDYLRNSRKNGGSRRPRDFRGVSRLVIVVVVEDSEAFVALVGAGWRRRWFPIIRTVEVNNGF